MSQIDINLAGMPTSSLSEILSSAPTGSTIDVSYTPPPIPPMPADSSSVSTSGSSSSVSSSSDPSFQALENYFLEQDIAQADQQIAAQQSQEFSGNNGYGTSYGYNADTYNPANYGYNTGSSNGTSSSSNLTSEIELLLMLEQFGQSGTSA
jgi:hypothetical protein